VHRIPESAAPAKSGNHYVAKVPQFEAENYNATAQSGYPFLSPTFSNPQNSAVKSSERYRRSIGNHLIFSPMDLPFLLVSLSSYFIL
jgi:hypothetical protein